jgi:regulator of protease activity HflC (stomatin/prohibitin superfamily)
MSSRWVGLFEFVRGSIIAPLGRLVAALAMGVNLRRLVLTVALAALAYGLYTHPPFATASRGEVLVRANMLDGSVSAYSAGTVLVLPGIHQARRYTTRDQMYRPAESASATGPAPFQSNEGLSIGVDLTVRWAIDRARIAQTSKDFPDDLNNDLVRPAVQGIVYPLFARYSVREIFSGRRAEIQQEIMKELRPRLAARGLLLRGVDMGQVDLPPDYRAGMEKLLAEELETEKIRYTLPANFLRPRASSNAMRSSWTVLAS